MSIKTKRRSILPAAIGLLSCSALVLAACGSPSSPTGKGKAHGQTQTSASAKAPTATSSTSGGTELRVGIVTSPVGASLLDIGKTKGYFSKNGLNVKVVTFQSGSALGSAIEGGSVDTGLLGGAGVVFAASGGGDIYYAQSGETNELKIFGSPAVKDVQDLQGHTVALPEGTGAQILLRVALENSHLPLSSVKLVNTQPAGVVEAFTSHRVDAAVIWPPFTSAIQSKDPTANLVASAKQFPKALTYDVFASRPTYISSHTDTLAHFCKALSEATSWLEANTQQADQLIYKTTFTTLMSESAFNDAMAGLTYSTIAQQLSGMQKLKAALANSEEQFEGIGGLKKFVPVSQWFTPTILQRAAKSQ